MADKEKNIPVDENTDQEFNEEKLEEIVEEVTKKEIKSTKASKRKNTKEKNKIQEIQDKFDTLNDKYLRLYSEFDNYRKRTLKEKLEMTKTASESLMVDLLTILDDFERAIKSSKDTDNLEAIRDGEVLIYNKFNKLLGQKGLKPIEAIGEVFDTDLHEAITKFPAPSEDLKGKVIDETEKGYTLNGKVIRYSKVVIGE